MVTHWTLEVNLNEMFEKITLWTEKSRLFVCLNSGNKNTMYNVVKLLVGNEERRLQTMKNWMAGDYSNQI